MEKQLRELVDRLRATRHRQTLEVGKFLPGYKENEVEVMTAIDAARGSWVPHAYRSLESDWIHNVKPLTIVLCKSTGKKDRRTGQKS
jgi:hypothetical protein